MANIKSEFKRELSKITGEDYFNPKFRELFDRYFPDDDKDVEEVKEKPVEELEKPSEEERTTIDAENNEVKHWKLDEVEKVEGSEHEVKEPVEDKVEDIEKAEDEREIDKIEEDKAEEPVVEDEKKEEVAEESEEIGKDVNELKDDKLYDELLDAKIENELIKDGVRPERLNSAKKYVKVEVHSLEELDKIHEILKEYPEWVRGYHAESFGSIVNDEDDGLTAEEKRLKELGIE